VLLPLLIGLSALFLVPVLSLAIAARIMTRPARAVIGSLPEGLTVETVAFRSGNGSMIRGWYLPGREGAGAVALFHGVRGNRAAALPRMRFLNAAGYGALAIDFQAHGESEGSLITFGRRESFDASAAIAWLRSRTSGPIAAMGASLGGAALLLGDRLPPVDAIILEEVYPTIDQAVRHRMERRLGAFGRSIAPLYLRIGEIVTGIRREELRPIERMPHLTMPVFVMGGTLDPSTPIEETRAMFHAARGDRELWEVEGAGHLDLHAFAPEDYEQRVLAFLRRSLTAAGSRQALSE
jgi:fermentation-respiration switch protein FrsA (DUF1100 family)